MSRTPGPSSQSTEGGRKCPLCGEPRDPMYRPFCSKRCADLDLHRWFSGAYAIPAVEIDEPDDESSEG